jgi:diguanylate cyclase (GGDEF)-like protein/putative nucleotidyltransferase with HDIG domain
MARILIAEDEEALRQIMERQLRRAGHQVSLAEDGLAALERLMAEEFDVVLSDMKMPRLDGMGLLERANEIAPTTEFIILTGHGNMENAVEAFRKGNVYDYLLKPLEDINELDAVVARAAERRHLRSDNTRLIAELKARIEELEEARRTLAIQAERDSLTGLFNHRAIHERVEALLEDGGSVAVIMMDLDCFKGFNDTYGHPVGDQVLKHLAEALRRVANADGALLARYGGDEFVVALPNACAREAQTVAEKVREHLERNSFVGPDNTRLPLRLCYGIADSTTTGPSLSVLMAAADAALYSAKGGGGDAIRLHHAVETPAEPRDRTGFGIYEMLIAAIDHKDRYTKQHSEDVTRYAIQLAEAIGASEQSCDALRLAGLLHDVGKIALPDQLLQKPGKLTAEEYEMMKDHVRLSTVIICGLPRQNDVLDAVATHHERWDGKGYPRQLAGEQIPLLGRILAVADAFSAMTTDRPYRAHMSFDEALEEIERCAGTQLDPDLAQVFVRCIRKMFANEFKKAA